MHHAGDEIHMAQYIELSKIGLDYHFTGIEKKIHDLIASSCKVKITYEEVKKEKKYKNGHNKMKAFFAGHSDTYTAKIPIRWEYKTSDLIEFFENHSTVIFRRKEVEFDSQAYIQKIKTAKPS